MPVITKVSQDLVFDLINQSNPNSPVKFSPNNLKLGKMTTLTPTGGAIQNTKIMLSNKPTSEYIGRVEVSYRRIDLAKLFRGLTITMNKFSLLAKSSTTAWNSFVKDLLPTFNTMMGTAFTADDLVDVAVGRGSLNAQNRYQNTITISAAATSLAYVGSFSFTWVDAPQDIDTIVTVTDLNGRAFPGGNVFDANHPCVLNGIGYAVDWTDTLTDIYGGNFAITENGFVNAGNFASGMNAAVRVGIEAMLAQLNTMYPSIPKFTPSAMYDKWTYRFTPLPASGFPEANAEFFNRALILTPNAPGTTGDSFAGILMLHYNY